MQSLDTTSACTRCPDTGNRWVTMSWFNLDLICEDCGRKEAEHPDFEKAKEVELLHCQSGNFNFPGVGRPEDL